MELRRLVRERAAVPAPLSLRPRWAAAGAPAPGARGAVRAARFLLVPALRGVLSEPLPARRAGAAGGGAHADGGPVLAAGAGEPPGGGAAGGGWGVCPPPDA